MFRPSITESKLTVVKRDVSYKPHVNGWGLVAETASVDKSVFVDRSSTVHAHAVVTGRVRVEEGSEICENAHVSGSVRLSRTIIPADAELLGNLTLKKGRILPTVIK